jgi:hypothetical protein
MFPVLVLLSAAASLVHAACDVNRSVNVCLQSDLNQCKSNANGDAAKCACVTTAQVCITTAGCDKEAAILGTLQLAYAAMAQTCEMPESTALASVNGACSTTGQTFCLNAVNWCARVNRGTGFPQPAVCNGCIDTLSACLNKYQCRDAYAMMAFKLAGSAYQCGDVSARFNATASVGGDTTSTATNGITNVPTGSSSSASTVSGGSTSSSPATMTTATADGSTASASQQGTNSAGSTTNVDLDSTTTAAASRTMFVNVAGVASVLASILAIVA